MSQIPERFRKAVAKARQKLEAAGHIPCSLYISHKTLKECAGGVGDDVLAGELELNVWIIEDGSPTIVSISMRPPAQSYSYDFQIVTGL